ncbi:Uncharacterized conserved protein, implicated in type VI secretion and phage assembly [Cnuella takakiae]|uniref:Uncharacterized conserved protein, implicated in type VI secretion and phage assembly n=1 Tax=Cnuella takakiae TaxID=1302690 RepID=A0A1M4ZE13_9BACT|nr:phage baseplate assembly protein V [Cnuella takakiae]OLY94240.1 hypothetical protein BUE76_21895 [Cnuella takakiae]SHF16195.1 Uncharacterized conserved protein, implicated in type VI secretion and phage assembly [Cnuella takakiae]
MPLTALLTDVNFTQYACTVLVNGQPLPEVFQLISVQVRQAYQHITSAQLLLKQSLDLGGTPLPVLSGGTLPLSGQPLTIQAKHDADTLILFEGTIVRHKFKHSAGGSRLQLTAKTKAVNLSLTSNTEVFAGQTDKEVIETIVRGGGCRLSPTAPLPPFMVKHTQLVKNGLSNWDFINLRAEANGCFLYTEGEAVVLEKPREQVDPLKVLTARYGDNVFELEVEQDERKYRLEDELISFNPATFETETADETEPPTTDATTVKGKQSIVDYRTFHQAEARDRVAAATQLKTLSKHNGLAHIRAQFEAKPGYTLAVEGFNEIADGRYVITSVMHDYGDGGFSTFVQFGLNHEGYATRFGLAPAAARPLVLNALVTALEGDPDNLYRVQVKIAGWAHAQEPLWARLLTPYAGDGYGLVLLPEIGDEVLVAFTGTDYDVPLVLGSSFSPKLPPHTPFTDDNYPKVLVTKKGMKWAWNDEKGEHEISTPAGNKILLSEDQHTVSVADENGNKVELTRSAITVTGSKDVTIKAATNLKLEGAMIDVNASGNLTLKGAMVLIN